MLDNKWFGMRQTRLRSDAEISDPVYLNCYKLQWGRGNKYKCGAGLQMPPEISEGIH
jgi:hypothetical protein